MFRWDVFLSFHHWYVSSALAANANKHQLSLQRPAADTGLRDGTWLQPKSYIQMSYSSFKHPDANSDSHWSVQQH